jgi:gliding motility-associated-like protein
LGSLEISLTNIADGEKMGVDLNNDLIPEDSLIAKANKIILEDLPNGYSVKNILLTKFSTKCNAGKLFTGTVNPPFLPDVNLSEYKPVCKSEEAFILKGGSPSGGTYLVDNVAATSIIPSVLGVGPHTVIYRYTNADNCSNSDTAQLVIEDLPKVIIEGDGMNMCPNMAQASYSSVMYRNHNYQWEVEGGQITEGQNLPNVDVMWDKDQDLKKRLKLKITNSISGCFDTTSRAINIVDTIPPFIMECAENITLKAEAGLNGWEAKLSEANGLKIPEADDNCADEPTLTFSVNNSGFHELSELEGLNVDALKPASILWQVVDLYENKSECVTKIDFDYIEVVPSAFSPNDDATNNTWEINFLFQYPNSVVRVYNRWGIKVFESEKGYPVPWDGTCNGRKVPVESYYYSIAIGDKDNKELKGNVTVIY